MNDAKYIGLDALMDREPGDGCPLAPIWVCNLLAGNFQRPADRWPEKDFQGRPRSDLSDGGGELHLGRSTYSRRTSHLVGFDISERTISRWMKRAPRNPEPAKRWLAFLRNHREAIAAMDFFTVPTVTFSLLYCFFVIGHDRRRILHINVTRQPTSAWIIQQLREALPYQAGPRFLIFDRDSKHGLETPIAVRSMGLIPVRTSFESPWQNGIAERWVESYRRDLFDHVIAMNEAHLKRLLSEYVRYFHEDRTHLGLQKEISGRRVRAAARGGVTALPRLGGLHHRYERVA